MQVVDTWATILSSLPEAVSADFLQAFAVSAVATVLVARLCRSHCHHCDRKGVQRPVMGVPSCDACRNLP